MPNLILTDLSEELLDTAESFAKYGLARAQNSAEAEGSLPLNTFENDQKPKLPRVYTRPGSC